MSVLTGQKHKNIVRGLLLVSFIGVFAQPMLTHANDTRKIQPEAVISDLKGKASKKLTNLITVPNGIHGSFSSAGKVIHFETRRGPQTPEHLRAGNPTAPLYEIDVRFLDAEGNTYLLQIGGDAPIDPTWETTQPKSKSAQDAKNDFDLAQQAVENIKRLKFNRKFKPEQMALINLLSVIEEAQVTETVEANALATPKTQGVVHVNSYRHRVQIHHESCCLGLGRHSATIGKYISDGVTTTAVITCNHGTCANQMALKCSWTSAYPGNRATHLLNYVTCSTPYNPTSVFGHNSNDDTDLQYRAVRYNALPSRNGGMCNDSSVNNEPTHCY